MEGNIDLYGKSGFAVASTKRIHDHAEPRTEDVPYFLLKELTFGYLNGIEGVYHPPQATLSAERNEFDAHFPYKEKLRLPDQLE